MLSKLRTRLTYANVMATMAVFIALGGSSYAAITVTGKNVKNGSLTGKDIKNSSLTTSNVKNRSLLALDFKSGQLPSGPQGAKGDKGDKGDKGNAGATNVVVRKGDLAAVNTPPGLATSTVSCNPGEVAVGGGHDFSGQVDPNFYDDGPTGSPTPTGWRVSAWKASGSGISFQAEVICASP